MRSKISKSHSDVSADTISITSTFCMVICDDHFMNHMKNFGIFKMNAILRPG